MKQVLALSVILPFTCTLLFLLLSARKKVYEAWISHTAFIVVTVLCGFSAFSFAFLLQHDFLPQVFSFGLLYESIEYVFPLEFLLDTKSVALLSLTSFISLVIIKFSRYYLHREEGYGRFFATVFLFITGMNLVALANTLDLFFAAWELLGISSFLLIGFYYHRHQPRRHALQTFVIYRSTDVGLFLGSFVFHLVFHDNLYFSKLALVDRQHLSPFDSTLTMILGFLLLLSALGKSAQFPFSFWLPKAMEGPTPSSAIFYGGLSIHAGVFLLLRTFPLWGVEFWPRLAIGAFGLVTALTSTLSGKVQANIKGQIAYASSAQVGLMLVEMALGLENLVLVHMVAHALLRSYQLLISPSAVAELIKSGSFQRSPSRGDKWSVSLYAFALNEGYMEILLRRWVWQPLNLITSWFHGPWPAIFFLWLLYYIDKWNLETIIAVLLILALSCSLRAFASSTSRKTAWFLVGAGLLLSGITFMLHSHEILRDGMIFVVGILPCWLLGFFLLPSPSHKLKMNFQAFGFLICCLALIGFPLFPTFLGEDLLLHAHSKDDVWLVALIAAQFVLNGIILVRFYVQGLAKASLGEFYSSRQFKHADPQ